MQVKHFLTAAVATTALAFAGVASGQTHFEWLGGTSNDWRNPANWSWTGDTPPSPQYPRLDDHEAIITDDGSAPVLNLEPGSLTIGKLTVEEDGVLTVQNTDPDGEKLIISVTSLDGSVTVDADGQFLIDDAGHVEVQGPTELKGDASNPGGLLRLQDDDAEVEFKGLLTIEFAANPGRLEIGTNQAGEGGTARFAYAANPHANSGVIVMPNAASRMLIDQNTAFVGLNSGVIVGEHPAAEIVIADGMRLEIDGTTLEGTMLVDAAPSVTAEFHNFGRVVANEPDARLILGSGLDLVDDSSALWEASGMAGCAPAILQFNRAHLASASAELFGDFKVVDCGEIEFIESVQTRGDLQTPREGAIDTNDANPSIFFTYNFGLFTQVTILGRNEYDDCSCE